MQRVRLKKGLQTRLGSEQWEPEDGDSFLPVPSCDIRNFPRRELWLTVKRLLLIDGR